MDLVGTLIIFEMELGYYGSVDQPWFKIDDIGQVLGYSKREDPSKLTEVNEKGFTTEEGLYDICLRSTKPKARRISQEVRNLLVILRKGGHLRSFKTFKDVMAEFEERIIDDAYDVDLDQDFIID